MSRERESSIVPVFWVHPSWGPALPGHLGHTPFSERMISQKIGGPVGYCRGVRFHWSVSATGGWEVGWRRKQKSGHWRGQVRAVLRGQPGVSRTLLHRCPDSQGSAGTSKMLCETNIEDTIFRFFKWVWGMESYDACRYFGHLNKSEYCTSILFFRKKLEIYKDYKAHLHEMIGCSSASISLVPVIY